MAEKVPQATAISTDDDPTRGLPYHNKIKADLDEMLVRKRTVDRNVVCHISADLMDRLLMALGVTG